MEIYPNTQTIAAIHHYLWQLQQQLVFAFQTEDPTAILTCDQWQRPQGGGGRTMVLAGDIIESGGINFSHVYGEQMPGSATAHRPELTGSGFQAIGLSFIIHPKNPYVPTMHGNIRFFIANNEQSQQPPIWWFGGGFDLTPYYGFVEDCILWHELAAKICEPYGKEVYPQYKKWCDDYFYLKHRQEARGIGGLFFDDLNEWGFEKCQRFFKDVGDNFITAYIPIMQKRKHTPYSQRERDFQCYRRGRYVEFNLIYDRGTLFGLQSGGRTESILVSLPKVVNWHYNYQPKSGTPEAALYEDFLPAKDWLAMSKLSL